MSEDHTSYNCDKCDRVFDTIQGLNGHQLSHVLPPGPCPECGRDDFASAISFARHRNMAHGVVPAYKRKQQGVMGRPRLTAVDPLWKVDEVFTAVVGSLYPNGAVPIHAIPILIQWREDTQRMLEKVLNV